MSHWTLNILPTSAAFALLASLLTACSTAPSETATTQAAVRAGPRLGLVDLTPFKDKSLYTNWAHHPRWDDDQIEFNWLRLNSDGTFEGGGGDDCHKRSGTYTVTNQPQRARWQPAGTYINFNEPAPREGGGAQNTEMLIIGNTPSTFTLRDPNIYSQLVYPTYSATVQPMTTNVCIPPERKLTSAVQ